MFNRACFFVLLCFFAGQAHSALVDNGVVTTDTSSGLNWLDLSESLGLSYDYVSSQFGSGGDFVGYRHATRDETEDFFANAGIVGVTNGYNDFNYQPILDLAALLGTPLNPPTTGVRGVFDEFLTSNNTYSTWVPLVNHTNLTGVIGYSNSTPDSSGSTTGHFLVSVSPVPVPAAVWLFGTALLGLVGFSKRRQAS